MKKILVPTIAFLLGVSVTAIVSWKSSNSEKIERQNSRYDVTNPETRPVIALRKVKLKSGTSAETFETYATKLAHSEYGKMPGVKEYVAKGERGE